MNRMLLKKITKVRGNTFEKRLSLKKIGLYFFGFLEKTHKKTWLIPSVIFCISLGIRLAYLLTIKNDPLFTTPILDAKFYSDWALQIAHKTSSASSAFFVEPGYAYLLAFVYKFFGQNFFPIILLQIILGSLTQTILFLCAKELWKNTLASTVTALIVVLFQPFIFYDLLLLKTTFEIFGVTLIIYLLIKTWERKSPWNRFLLGLFVGIVSIIKANLLYSLPFLALSLLPTKRQTRKKLIQNIAALFLGATIVIFPVTLHNWQKSHSLVPINYSGGPNLYIGSWEQADGSLKPPEFISVDPTSEETSWQKATEAFLHHEPSPSEISSFWTGQAIREMFLNPLRTMGLVLKKIVMLFGATTFDDNYDIAYGKKIFPLLRFLLPFWPIAILGILGLFAHIFSSKNKRLALPLYVIFASYTTTIVASHVAERYRLALFPIFAIFAGYFAFWILEKIRQADFATVTKYVTAFMVLTFLAWIPFPETAHTTIKDMHNNFGAQYEAAENIKQAKEQYALSLKMDEKYVPAVRNLARIALREGNADEAIEKYRAALQIQYDLSTTELKMALDAKNEGLSEEKIKQLLQQAKQDEIQKAIYDADYIEGMKFFRKREFDKAAEKFEKAYRRNNSSEAIMTNLATSYKNSNEPDKAQKFFEKTLEINDYNLPAHYNLGNLFSAKKSYPQAIAHYERINEIVPGFQLSRFYLAQSYAENKEMQKSIDAYRLFIEESEHNPAFRKQVEEAKKIVEKATPKIFK